MGAFAPLALVVVDVIVVVVVVVFFVVVVDVGRCGSSLEARRFSVFGGVCAAGCCCRCCRRCCCWLLWLVRV